MWVMCVDRITWFQYQWYLISPFLLCWCIYLTDSSNFWSFGGKSTSPNRGGVSPNNVCEESRFILTFVDGTSTACMKRMLSSLFFLPFHHISLMLPLLWVMFQSASFFFIVTVVLSYPIVPTDALQDKEMTLLFCDSAICIFRHSGLGENGVWAL